MARALVTGASGFVGANLARRLVGDGHETHVILRPAHAPWRLRGMANDLVVHDGDVSDPASVAAIIDAVQPDHVFHLAAYGAYPTQTDLESMIRTNIVGTCAIVDAAVRSGVTSTVIAGSSSEYGLKSVPPSESAVLAPNSDYAVTKAAGTLYAQKEAQRTGAVVTTLRLYSVFGPWEEPSRFWPTLAIHALEGRMPKLADASTARDFVYVDDVVEAFVRAARQSRGSIATIINVGTGSQTTLAAAVHMARERFPAMGTPIWGSMPGRSWDTSIWVAENRLAREHLDWEPAVDVGSGFDRLSEWLDAEPGMVDFYRDRVAR